MTTEKKEFTGQIITLNRPSLFAPKLPNGLRRPSLSAMLVYDNPRLVVKPGLETDQELPNFGKILAPMSSDAWRNIVDYIIPKIATLEPGKQISIKNMTPAKNGEGETDVRLPPVLVSTTILGRDKDGICFIAIKSADDTRPAVKFSTMPNAYHPITGPDGKEFDPPLISFLTLKSFFKKIDDAFGPKLNEVWDPNAAPTNNNWKDRNKTGGKPTSRPAAAADEPKFQDVEF
jgi:hypothetical protein